MKKLKWAIPLFCLLTVPFLLSSCAEIREATCNTNAAYSSGVNDALAGNYMDTDYASICQANVPQINRAYRRGYRFGLREKRRHHHRPHVRYYNN